MPKSKPRPKRTARPAAPGDYFVTLPRLADMLGIEQRNLGSLCFRGKVHFYALWPNQILFSLKQFERDIKQYQRLRPARSADFYLPEELAAAVARDEQTLAAYAQFMEKQLAGRRIPRVTDPEDVAYCLPESIEQVDRQLPQLEAFEAAVQQARATVEQEQEPISG